MKKLFYLILALSILGLSGCELVRILNYKMISSPNLVLRQNIEPEIIRRKIDGQEVKSEAEANLYPVAIMVENAADSWPASGLDKANLVFEAITEGSIPRFVALYANSEEIKKIGPVRSARPYYLDWIDPYEPLYLHVGGSPDALAKIKSGNCALTDLNQFWNAQNFWRDKWRYAPHNVYTSSELIKQALADKELTAPTDYQTWPYKKDLELEKRPEQVNDIAINYAQQYYKVRWQYNREENNYIRYQNGDIHKMSDGEWIKAKNVIVQVNDMIVLDEVGRKKITTTGEGKAWIFRDGETTAGQWKKDDIKSIIKYYDNNGKEIELNGGTTWVEVIPNEDFLRY
ncbi:MAG: DUF3048 domain-containing protein [Patescibacteria group bacterium]